MTSITPISTLNDLFSRLVARANPKAVLWQDELGRWRPISSDQFYQRVRAMGKALLEWGVQKGDRVALVGENRWEWAVAAGHAQVGEDAPRTDAGHSQGPYPELVA